MFSKQPEQTREAPDRARERERLLKRFDAASALVVSDGASSRARKLELLLPIVGALAPELSAWTGEVRIRMYLLMQEIASSLDDPSCADADLRILALMLSNGGRNALDLARSTLWEKVQQMGSQPVYARGRLLPSLILLLGDDEPARARTLATLKGASSLEDEILPGSLGSKVEGPTEESQSEGRDGGMLSAANAVAAEAEDDSVRFRDVHCKISGKEILKGITLGVKRGEIMGILGRNGAGKSTLLSLVSGLRSQSMGDITVLGVRMPSHANKFRKRMGFVLQEDALYQELTLFENLEFSAGLYGVENARERILEVLELLGLSDRRDQVVGTLSGGLKRRTAIARAFLHDPELFIIDEPTLGVDADARHAVWAYLRLLKSRKRTVIVATNYLDEALALCDRVAVLEQGRLLAVEEPRELVRRTGSCIDLECDELTAQKIASGVVEVPQVIRADMTLSGVSLFLNKGAKPDEVLNQFSKYGSIEGFRLRAPDLSEVFKSLGQRP